MFYENGFLWEHVQSFSDNWLFKLEQLKAFFDQSSILRQIHVLNEWTQKSMIPVLEVRSISIRKKEQYLQKDMKGNWTNWKTYVFKVTSSPSSKFY